MSEKTSVMRSVVVGAIVVMVLCIGWDLWRHRLPEAAICVIALLANVGWLRNDAARRALKVEEETLASIVRRGFR